MMTDKKFNGFVGFTQVRSSIGGKSKKKTVYTRGYAATPDKFDVYMHQKNTSNNTTKEFRSLFTDKCLDDLEKQLLTKSIFIDAGHTLAADDGVLRLLREQGVAEDSEEYHTAKEMLKMKKLPLAKVTGFKIDDKGLMLETETNPHFAELDSEHESYYDAVCNSLLEKYYTGYSLNFQPVEFANATDDSGNDITQFDKINLYGISYATNLPLADNSFTDVCVRMAQEGFANKGVNTMKNIGNLNTNETTENTQNEKQKQPEQPQPKVDVDAIREQVRAEIVKEQQFEEMKKQQELMKKELDELRAKPAPTNEGVKGVVSNNTADKYGQKLNVDNGTVGNKALGEFNPTKREDWRQKVNEIAEGYNKWFDDISKPTPPDLVGFAQSYRGRPQDGFAELIRIQSMLKSHEMKKPGETEDQHRTRVAYLSQRPSDEMVLSRRREY